MCPDKDGVRGRVSNPDCELEKKAFFTEELPEELIQQIQVKDAG